MALGPWRSTSVSASASMSASASVRGNVDSRSIGASCARGLCGAVSVMLVLVLLVQRQHPHNDLRFLSHSSAPIQPIRVHILEACELLNEHAVSSRE